MRSRFLTLSACALAGVLVASDVALAQGKKGGPAAPNPRIEVTFADAGGDRIVSDEGVAYTDCDADATPGDCAGLGQIWAGGSEDATFRMAADSPRRFHVYCPAEIASLECSVDEMLSPDGWFLNIRGIGTMTSGANAVKMATFSFDGDQGGSLPEASLPVKRFTWSGTNSLMVAVTRMSSTEWLVTTVPPASTSAVGPSALLDQAARRGFTTIGTYEMPFALAIECIKDCGRLTVP